MSEKSVGDQLEKTAEDLQAYLRTQMDYLRLELIDKVVRFSSMLVMVILLSMVAFSALLLISVGVGAYLNELFDSLYGGYLLVGGIYLLLGIIMFLLRKPLIFEPMLRQMVGELFEEDEMEFSDQGSDEA